MTPRQKNRLTLLVIIGIFVAFILAGRLINVANLPKNNKGHLIVPHVPIDRLQLTHDDAPFDSQAVRHWSLMYIAGEGCPVACKNALFYQMQRTRLALGQDGQRLQLLVVANGDNPELTGFVRDKLTNTLLLEGHTPWMDAALKTALAGAPAGGHVFLVSPDGMIFMWYDSHPDKDGMIQESSHIYEDVRTTLKGSLAG